ncbi:MAG: hypothetical protein JW744_03730 [Candidatus Diapherotrites archaeon]|uniref:Uncharacterized protein n=1 Tax=Candidatus Iainarchaeum sp. TaxID=3101447 RepID=A0A938YWR7_9ARCH|nr:hypothetical protein [Candidatus Diapherotrites archaeon]
MKYYFRVNGGGLFAFFLLLFSMFLPIVSQNLFDFSENSLTPYQLIKGIYISVEENEKEQNNTGGMIAVNLNSGEYKISLLVFFALIITYFVSVVLYFLRGINALGRTPEAIAGILSLVFVFLNFLAVQEFASQVAQAGFSIGIGSILIGIIGAATVYHHHKKN